MELKELIAKLDKLPKLEDKIKFLEELVKKEKDSKKKAELETLLKKIKEFQKKEEKSPEKKKAPLRLEDIIIKGNIPIPNITLELTEQYLRDTAVRPAMPVLPAVGAARRDRFKEEYIEKKEYIERNVPGREPGQNYTPMETPEYIERLRVEQTRLFRPAEEQKPFEMQLASQPRAELTREEYRRQEAVKEMLQDKELIKEEYLREKRRRGMM